MSRWFQGGNISRKFKRHLAKHSTFSPAHHCCKISNYAYFLFLPSLHHENHLILISKASDLFGLSLLVFIVIPFPDSKVMTWHKGYHLGIWKSNISSPLTKIYFKLSLRMSFYIRLGKLCFHANIPSDSEEER